MLLKHLKHLTIDLHYADKEFDFIIDAVVHLNGEYYSNYHLKDIEDLPSIIKEIRQDYLDEKLVQKIDILSTIEVMNLVVYELNQYLNGYVTKNGLELTLKELLNKVTLNK